MAIQARVWTAGKFLLLVGALAATFVVFAVMAARVAVRARDVSVPDLVGRSINDATALTLGLELQLTVDETRRPGRRGPGRPRHRPGAAAGSSSRRQRSVRVWLSSGPRIARAPALVGESQRAAEIRIVQDGLIAGPVAEIRSALYPPDVVVAQDPCSGRADHRGAPAGEPRRRPHVVRDARLDRRRRRPRGGHPARARLPRLDDGTEVASGLPPGVVTRQSPAGGYQVHPGDAITIEVSR